MNRQHRLTIKLAVELSCDSLIKAFFVKFIQDLGGVFGRSFEKEKH